MRCVVRDSVQHDDQMATLAQNQLRSLNTTRLLLLFAYLALLINCCFVHCVLLMSAKGIPTLWQLKFETAFFTYEFG